MNLKIDKILLIFIKSNSPRFHEFLFDKYGLQRILNGEKIASVVTPQHDDTSEEIINIY